MVQLICRRQLAQAADKLNVQFAFCHVKLSYEIFNGKIIYAIFMQINIHKTRKKRNTHVSRSFSFWHMGREQKTNAFRQLLIENQKL